MRYIYIYIYIYILLHHDHSMCLRKMIRQAVYLDHVDYLMLLNSLAIDMELRMWQKCHALAAGAGKRTNKESVKEAVSDA